MNKTWLVSAESLWSPSEARVVKEEFPRKEPQNTHRFCLHIFPPCWSLVLSLLFEILCGTLTVPDLQQCPFHPYYPCELPQTCEMNWQEMPLSCSPQKNHLTRRSLVERWREQPQLLTGLWRVCAFLSSSPVHHQLHSVEKWQNSLTAVKKVSMARMWWMLHDRWLKYHKKSRCVSLFIMLTIYQNKEVGNRKCFFFLQYFSIRQNHFTFGNSVGEQNLFIN